MKILYIHIEKVSETFLKYFGKIERDRNSLKYFGKILKTLRGYCATANSKVCFFNKSANNRLFRNSNITLCTLYKKILNQKVHHQGMNISRNVALKFLQDFV